jgi:hypothetical protein
MAFRAVDLAFRVRFVLEDDVLIGLENGSRNRVVVIRMAHLAIRTGGGPVDLVAVGAQFLVWPGWFAFVGIHVAHLAFHLQLSMFAVGEYETFGLARQARRAEKGGYWKHNPESRCQSFAILTHVAAS